MIAKCVAFTDTISSIQFTLCIIYVLHLVLLYVFVHPCKCILVSCTLLTAIANALFRTVFFIVNSSIKLAVVWQMFQGQGMKEFMS